MKNILLPLLLLSNILLFTSCKGQIKPIGEEPLNLETFNFDIKISDLYPEKNKSKNYKGYYEIKGAIDSQLVVRDTAFADQYLETRKAIGIEYRQQSSTSLDTMAVFKNQKFEKINVATTIEGKIKALSAVADELTKKQSNLLIQNLENKYGKPKKLINRWNEKFTIYEWVKNNKIIRLVPTLDDESTTIKLLINKEKQTITPGEKEPHYVAYLFIINPALKSEVFGKAKTGDFVFLDEKTE